jgi:predicted GIY-YIG superfamily endonuclease
MISDSVSGGWVVYIVKCRDGSLYTGITNNLYSRIASHNNGTAARYTRSRLPVKLLYFEKHPDRSSASKREWEIKKLTLAKKNELIAIQREYRSLDFSQELKE